MLHIRCYMMLHQEHAEHTFFEYISWEHERGQFQRNYGLLASSNGKVSCLAVPNTRSVLWSFWRQSRVLILAHLRLVAKWNIFPHEIPHVTQSDEQKKFSYLKPTKYILLLLVSSMYSVYKLSALKNSAIAALTIYLAIGTTVEDMKSLDKKVNNLPTK